MGVEKILHRSYLYNNQLKRVDLILFIKIPWWLDEWKFMEPRETRDIIKVWELKHLDFHNLSERFELL